MCTVVVLRRPGHPWPLIVAANRDERIDRPWRPPGRHWPDTPGVVAGIDDLAGGTWLGLNDRGVVAGVLNRPRSLGPDGASLSRGFLPLAALGHDRAAAACQTLGAMETARYRTFNMIVGDREAAFWLRSAGGEDGVPKGTPVAVAALPAGVSMITAHDRNDMVSFRVRRFLPLFQTAAPPDPGRRDWAAWQDLMARRDHDPAGTPGDAMTVVTDCGFGTVSSSLIALPADTAAKPVWLFATPGDEYYEVVRGT